MLEAFGRNKDCAGRKFRPRQLFKVGRRKPFFGFSKSAALLCGQRKSVAIWPEAFSITKLRLLYTSMSLKLLSCYFHLYNTNKQGAGSRLCSCFLYLSGIMPALFRPTCFGFSNLSSSLFRQI